MASDSQPRFRVPEQDDEEALSYAAIESELAQARGRQRVRVEELQDMRRQNVELKGALERDLSELRALSAQLDGRKPRAGLWTRIGSRLGALLGGEPQAQRSVEELLRAQYESSLVRLRRALELADRLERARSELYNEIDALNRRIVQSARYEDRAAERLLALQQRRDALKAQLAGADALPEQPRAQRRELQAELDGLRRTMAELSTQVQLHRTRDERLSRLKQSTRLLAETIANLGSDIRQYVHAADEKLALIGGQIQAVGAAADASLILVDLKRSIDGMTASMNEATQFVTEVQAFFHQHVDQLVGDLELYDEETRARLEVSQEFNQLTDERRIAQGLELAQAHAREAQRTGR